MVEDNRSGGGGGGQKQQTTLRRKKSGAEEEHNRPNGKKVFPAAAAGAEEEEDDDDEDDEDDDDDDDEDDDDDDDDEEEEEEDKESKFFINASKLGHLVEVQRLLAKPDVNPNTREKETNNTALILAAQNGRPMVVDALLASGADVNAANNNGDTPLILASLNGHGGVVDALLRVRQRGGRAERCTNTRRIFILQFFGSHTPKNQRDGPDRTTPPPTTRSYKRGFAL